MEKTTNKLITFAYKGMTPNSYNPQTALIVQAKDFISGKANFMATVNKFYKDEEHNTMVVFCNTIDELCEMEEFMGA